MADDGGNCRVEGAVMLILLVEGEPRVGDSVSALVAAAGHEVLRCHEPAWQAFPCVGMHSPCPLEAGADVVVVTRNRDNTNPSDFEDGARCAARSGAGRTQAAASSRFSSWITMKLVLAWVATLDETLPRMNRVARPRPLLPTMIRSVSTSSARSRVSPAGWPSTRWVRCSTVFVERNTFASSN